jgi:hypothetical protein
MVCYEIDVALADTLALRVEQLLALVIDHEESGGFIAILDSAYFRICRHTYFNVQVLRSLSLVLNLDLATI